MMSNFRKKRFQPNKRHFYRNWKVEIMPVVENRQFLFSVKIYYEGKTFPLFLDFFSGICHLGENILSFFKITQNDHMASQNAVLTIPTKIFRYQFKTFSLKVQRKFLKKKIFFSKRFPWTRRMQF